MTGREADFLTIKTRRGETRWGLYGFKSMGASTHRRSDRKPEGKEAGGKQGWSPGNFPTGPCHPQQEPQRVLLHIWRAGTTPHARPPILVCFAKSICCHLLGHFKPCPLPQHLALGPPAHPSRTISSPTSPGELMSLPETYFHFWPKPYY